MAYQFLWKNTKWCFMDNSKRFSNRKLLSILNFDIADFRSQSQHKFGFSLYLCTICAKMGSKRFRENRATERQRKKGE